MTTAMTFDEYDNMVVTDENGKLTVTENRENQEISSFHNFQISFKIFQSKALPLAYSTRTHLISTISSYLQLFGRK